MRPLEIDATEVVRLYVERGWRASRIARHLGCSEGVVYERLNQAGVTRSRRARLPRDEVVGLYVKEGWTLAAIAERFGVARSTVARHLREWGVPPPTRAGQSPRSGRIPCPVSRVFRAYALGFVWGDFCAETYGIGGSTVAVRGSTTKQAQVDAFRAVFGRYGTVKETSHGTAIGLRVSLDSSFEFLLSKYGDAMPVWINTPEAEGAFAAGYIDAEGSFGVYEGRARFKLDSYDVIVIEWLESWLEGIGVRPRRRLIGSRGEVGSSGARFTEDLWRVSVNDALSIRRLAATLEPFSKHGDRRATMAVASTNVLRRLRSRDPASGHPEHLCDQSCGSREIDSR